MIHLPRLLFIAVVFAVAILACGQNESPTRQTASTLISPTALSIPSTPASASPIPPTGIPATAIPAIPTATIDPTTAPADELRSGIPVYENVAIWGNALADGISFTSPNGIAIDSSDNVYVTEFRGNRVQKFTSGGALLAQWGSEGNEDGQFKNPTGITIDRDGNLYISESGNHRVQKFNAGGEWLTS